MKSELKTLFFAASLCLVLGFGLFQELRLAKHADPACQLYFKTKTLCASLEWIKKPTSENEGEFKLKFWDANSGSSRGPFVTPPGDLKVSLWMPAMGHGTGPVTVKREQGIVQVSHASFSMNGDWEIWVSLLSGNQFVEKARTTYRL